MEVALGSNRSGLLFVHEALRPNPLRLIVT